MLALLGTTMKGLCSGVSDDGGLWSVARRGLATGSRQGRDLRSPRGSPIGSGQMPTGHYMLNEFGARGRQGSLPRWGRLRGLRKWQVESGGIWLRLGWARVAL